MGDDFCPYMCVKLCLFNTLAYHYSARLGMKVDKWRLIFLHENTDFAL
jgi:hypothetical protein